MKTLSSLGRFFYALTFIGFGIGHFMGTSEMSGMIGMLPFAKFLVYFTGIALFLAAISIILNTKARLTTLLLALYLLLVILIIQLPGVLERDINYIQGFWKDVGLFGAALTYSGILKN